MAAVSMTMSLQCNFSLSSSLLPQHWQKATTSARLIPQFSPASGLKFVTTPNPGSLRQSARDSNNCVRRQSASSPNLIRASADAPLPSLTALPLISYINNNGLILPPVEANTEASVFAVLDANKKVQYIGFSKDVRNSLRTLMGRRPEFCYYYKLYNLEKLDQNLMIEIRKQWYSELGVPPAGNTDPSQRDQWEKPADAGSISERGKVAAATSKAKTMIQIMRDRGLKEEMVYDPTLLEVGKCDVLPTKALTAEELEAAAASGGGVGSRHVSVKAPSGETVEFDMITELKVATNGGWMYDVMVTKDDKDTRHRVICGRIYPDAVKMNEDQFLDRVFAFLLHKKVPRQTEGVLAGDQFGSNYFSVSEVAQKFDDFQSWFDNEEGELPEPYWRFNRLYNYGNEKAPLLDEKSSVADLAANRT